MTSVAIKKADLNPDYDEKFLAFKARAEAVSAEVFRFASKSEAVSFIIEFLKKENCDKKDGSAVWHDTVLFSDAEKKELTASLCGLSFDVTKENAAAAKVGITFMHWGLKDTGTLVEDATSIGSRLASSLPEIHIALLPTKNIYPDLLTLMQKIKPEKASYLAFITGPSRTSDIERILTIGVHGPERLLIVCVDDLGGEQ